MEHYYQNKEIPELIPMIKLKLDSNSTQLNRSQRNAKKTENVLGDVFFGALTKAIVRSLLISRNVLH